MLPTGTAPLVCIDEPRYDLHLPHFFAKMSGVVLNIAEKDITEYLLSAKLWGSLY